VVFFLEELIMASFEVLGVNHLGLAAKDPVKCRWFLQDVLGLEHLGDELVVPQKTMTAMFAPGAAPRAQTRLEIVSPQEGTSDGPISKYLEKKGGGIHHLAVTVNDIVLALERMKAKGVRMVDDSPRQGAHSTLIAFVHPESTGGLLIELVQETK
jgi:methylmalonyl-CoA/ethylmalonyl-CoA epimerase